MFMDRVDKVQENEIREEMWTDEEKENIVEFFDLLLKIDKRNNTENNVKKIKDN